MDPKVQETLKETLEPGETVLWESKTLPFKILDGKEGRQVLLQWVLSTVGILIFLVLILTVGNKSAAAIALLLVLLATLLLSPMLSYRRTQRQAYYITDRRALLVKPDGTVNAIERTEIDDCRLMPLDHGGVSLVVGSTLFPEGDKQLRWRSLHPKLGHTAKSYEGLTMAEGMVFYNIERAEEAFRLLRA